MTKPKVFPDRNPSVDSKLDEYNKLKMAVANQIYTEPEATSDSYANAIEEMRQKSLAELKSREMGNFTMADIEEGNKFDADMLARDKQNEMNRIQTERYADSLAKIETQPKPAPKYTQEVVTPKKVVDDFTYETAHDRYVRELSQPNYNCGFDMIPLPSKGKLYRDKRTHMKIGYMTTSDEVVLTSPNLAQSGDFLEILFNRKMLDTDLRYRDLHIGDRNAIMMWLRASAYGEIYPFTMYDSQNQPFSSEVDLNTLEYIPLGAEPDEEGLFDFTFPLCGKQIKFSLHTCGDIMDIDKRMEEDKKNNILTNNSIIYSLRKSIKEVDGIRDRRHIINFIDSLRIGDTKALNKYVTDIESGIDLNINVVAPGGESIATFLPINFSFFWPDTEL